MAANQKVHPDQFARGSESADYATGRRTVTYDVDIPDRRSHEPSQVRAKVTEFSKNAWIGAIHHGPHEEKDESGSYYKQTGTIEHRGPVSSVRAKLRTVANKEWHGVMKKRT